MNKANCIFCCTQNSRLLIFYCFQQHILFVLNKKMYTLANTFYAIRYQSYMRLDQKLKVADVKYGSLLFLCRQTNMIVLRSEFYIFLLFDVHVSKGKLTRKKVFRSILSFDTSIKRKKNIKELLTLTPVSRLHFTSEYFCQILKKVIY